MVEHLRALLLTQTASADLVEASGEERALYQEQAAQIDRRRLMKALHAFNDAVNNYKGGWQPQLTLELALLESLKEDEIPVIMETQRAAPGTSQKLPPAPQAEATAPGTPPVIEVTLIREKWMEMLKVLGKLNKTGPDLVQYFRALRVDGNVVYIGTDNGLFHERLNHPQKVELVERSLFAVHKIPLRVKVVMTAGDDMGAGVPNVDIDPNDPLLSEGAQLGATITPFEKTNRQQDSSE